MAPFLVIGALLCLFPASRGTDSFFWWLGLCLLATFSWLQQGRSFGLSWVSAALAGFCLLLLTNGLYLSPAYHANGIYVPATLLFAFVAATRCPEWFVQTGFKLFCGLIALIAVWALVQWLTGWGFIEGQDKEIERSLALFANPNTLATALNLGLAPILGFYLLGYGGHGVYKLTLLLFAALLAAGSRGGYLGLLVSVLFMVVFVGRAATIAQWRRYRSATLGFSVVIGFFKLFSWLGLGLAYQSLDKVLATLKHGDASNRLEIYKLAWQGLAGHVWLGNGYFNFGYYFEANKGTLFNTSQIIYVHNDYLQFAFETGLLGLGLFLLLIVAVYGQLFKFRQQAVSGQRLPLILPACAITSMLAHALVDYPFYIPVLVAVFGAYLGIINRQFIDMGAACWQLPKMAGQHLLGLRPAFISNALVIGLTAWLGLPAFAEVSADYGLHLLLHGDAQRGLYWHSIARVLQPRDASYYWREGIIWRDQGIVQNKPELLEKSIVLFNKGLEVNPFEVNNLLEKIALYRQHGTLFKQPVSHQDIMAWIKRAKSQQPYSEFIQMEYVRCLDFVGEHAEAVKQAKLLVQRRPKFKMAQKLLESVSHD